LAETAAPEQLPGYEEGWFSVQDVTAMSVMPMMGLRPGMRVLDLCAGPGGKTTHIAELMGNEGTIVACDISREKLSLVESNCKRLGITIVRTCLAEQLEREMQEGGIFDAILVDVPCSNTGVLGRRVEARHLLKPVVIQRLMHTQEELLEKAAEYVREGGTLTYSTCSIEVGENENQVQNFLEKNKAFRLSEEQFTLPGYRMNDSDSSGTIKDTNAPGGRDGGYATILKRIS
jgi:16S rRNA (cytosine967-C5)-methyltransferase